MQRINHHPSECLQLGPDGGLFCRACKSGISAKFANFSTHLSSAKHKHNVGEFRKRQKNEDEVSEFITDYYKANPSEAGGTVPPKTILFRWTGGHRRSYH
eukprot:scaffold38057_cov41-Tisochrysis_lutea.AAC.2